MSNVKYLISNKKRTINKRSSLKINLFYFLVFVFNFLFLIFNFTYAESLPPLPIKDLIKIDLKYDDTLIKPVPLDTLRIKIYAGNEMGGDISINRVVKKNWLFNFFLTGKKKFDFSDYLAGQSNFLFGFLYGDFWQEINLSVSKKIRKERYYDYLQFSYNPVIFTKNSTIALNNTLKKTRYIDSTLNNFSSIFSGVNYNVASSVGTINAKVDVFSQTINSSPPLTNISGEIKDLITVSDNFYISPCLNYDINQKRLSINNNLGFLISDVITNIDVQYNTIEKFSLDSLYADVYPYLVSHDLKYPVSRIKISASIQWHNFKVSGIYQEYGSFVNWTKQDTWLRPEIVINKHNQINVNLGGKYRFIENHLGINYIPSPWNLMSQYQISDSLLLKIKQWEFIGGITCAGKRNWYNQTLPSYYLITTQLGYHWRHFTIFTRVDNLLNNKYEILPNLFDKGIKYSAGFEFLK